MSVILGFDIHIYIPNQDGASQPALTLYIGVQMGLLAIPRHLVQLYIDIVQYVFQLAIYTNVKSQLSSHNTNRRVRGERRQLDRELRNQTTRPSTKKPDNSAESKETRQLAGIPFFIRFLVHNNRGSELQNQRF